MSSDEPGRVVAIAGALVLLVALVAGIVAIQFLVDQPYRHAATRLVAAAVLLVTLFRIRAFVRGSIERPSAWDERAGDARWAQSPQQQFEHFHDEIRFSARNQRYFDHVLWPRLCALAREGTEPPAELDPPRRRRFGRGPSVAALRALVSSVERRG